MHIQQDASDSHNNFLKIDDLPVTGGTVITALNLIKSFEKKEVLELALSLI